MVILTNSANIGRNMVAVATFDVTSVKTAVIAHSTATRIHVGMLEKTTRAPPIASDSPDF